MPADLAGRPIAGGRIVRVADACFAVESEPSAAANAGIVLGSERALVVDSRLTPALGAELGDLLADAGYPRERLIQINTHHHGDHVFGNEALGAATIVSSDAARLAVGEHWRRQVDELCKLRPAQAAEFRAAVCRAPEVGVERAATLDLGGVEVELEVVGPAHTPGDLIATAQDVCFVGDLVFHGHWPMLWDSDLRAWIERLDALAARAPGTVVPGHGPVGGPDILGLARECLAFLVRLHSGEVDRSARPPSDRPSGSDPAERPPPDAAVAASPFADWLWPERVAKAADAVRAQRSPELEALAR